MKASYSIEVDRDLSLVRIKMAGFFTNDDILAFLEARRKAHELLACAPNQHLTINDVRGFIRQPQTILDTFQEILNAREFQSRRLAFVVGPTLARSQVIRAIADRDARCFTDPVAAEQWLLDPDHSETSMRLADQV